VEATHGLTALLHAWRSGDADAQQPLNQQIYAALKRMARQRVGPGAASATLNPTALVHEAVARLLGSDADWRTSAHFFALAALQMRAVLVDHARRRGAAKRGGAAIAVTLDDELAVTEDDDGVLALHEALERLAAEDPRTARVLELTYFGGLTGDQVAEACAVSVATVERDLRFGRAWLKRELQA
jgi:RNA polymerase sigma factor (TIGR02999 family)